MAFRKIEAGLVHAPVDEFIGKTGTIFYDNDLGDFRISDGQTPGGIALSFGSGDGGTYTLPTATTTVKGGVKIDGSTITIANQVISVGTVPYSKLSGTPTIPTNNNQLTNGAAYITSSALSGYATETYVTTRGYLTTVAYADVTGKPTLFSGSYADLTNKPILFSGSYADLTNKPTIPTNTNELTNGAGYITSSALTGLATETYVTTRGYLTTVAYADVTGKPTIPTDINQLTDVSGLLGQGGGGGGTTYITNNVENPYSFSIAGDDSTLREISTGESIKITGAGGITVATDAEGNVTITGTVATEVDTLDTVTDRGNTTTNNITVGDITTNKVIVNTSAGATVTTGQIAWNTADLTFDMGMANGVTLQVGQEQYIKVKAYEALSDGQAVMFAGADGEHILARKYNPTVNGFIPEWFIGVATQDLAHNAFGYITVFGKVHNINTLGYALGDILYADNATPGALTNVAPVDPNPQIVVAAVTKRAGGDGHILVRPSFRNSINSLTDVAITTPTAGQVITYDGAKWVNGSGSTFSGSYTDLTNKPTLFSGSYNDLTDKPNLAGTYTFNVAADDSTLRTIGTEETVKFVGAGGITTASDDEGKITITQGTTSSLVNGANTLGLGSTGTVTFPNGLLKIAGNIISNYVVNDLGGGPTLSAGSQLEVSGAKTVITNGVTNSLEGTSSLTSQYLFEVNPNKILNAYQIINTLDDTTLTNEVLTELNNTGFKIGLRVTNDLGGGEPLIAFSGWTFGTVGQSQALTFPDSTVQTTAWTGIANALRSESNINIEVNLSDSTKRTWQFGEDGYLTLPDDRGINSSANINIAVNTPDSTTLNWQFGNDGALTLPGPGKITNGDYDWKFDTDGFFNAASILTLGNSTNSFIDKISTSQGFGGNIKQRGFRVDQYDNPITYSTTTRKTATGLTAGLASTADPTSTDYYEVIALLLPNLAANENFTVGIQMPTLNPFAAGWMAAYPDDAKQYRYRLTFQATYVIQGVTYNFTESYEARLETFGDSTPPALEEYISFGVVPIPDNNFIPGGSEPTATVNLDLNPVVAGWVTMRNFGTAFAKANGAAGLVPNSMYVTAGFSRNLDAALVWGRANTGTTVTNPNTSFDGIAYYQGIYDNAIVTDYNYMQMVLGQSYIGFTPNNIVLAHGTNIGENLNGSMVFGSRGLGNSSEAVAIGTGYGTIGDYAVAVGRYAGTDSGDSAVAVGNSAGATQGESAVAIGAGAGSSQGESAVAIGAGAGSSQGVAAVAVGAGAGNLSGDYAMAIGYAAGNYGQNAGAVAIGANSGSQSQGTYAIAMGFGAGYYGQRDNAVAIGSLAGAGTVYAQAGYVAAGSSGTTLIISRAVYSLGTIVPGMMIQAPGFSNQTVVAVDSATQLTISAAPDTAPENGYPLQFFKGQGTNSIAIGNQAGSPAIDILTDFQESNTIILNATGTSLMGVDGQENSFYVAPIRNASGADGLLQYNLTSKEVTYGKLSYNDLINKPDLAATYTWSIAADDSTLREILANETVKFIGAGSITTASDAEGNITITGAAPDRLTSNARSAVLNANGTFSLPTLTAAPATPQAGQMALANGTSWDPIAQGNGAPYMVIYTGSAWIGMGGGVTVDQVYNMILEMG